jgi:hypothetical protein
MLTAALAYSLCAFALGLVAYSLLILGKLYKTCRVEDITPEWLENFSASTYHPMESLLSDEDFLFLSRQPGFDLSLYKKLRRDRLNIFRQYLNRLISDFNRLHRIARVLLAHSPQDQSEAVARLIRLKLRFSILVFEVEARYILCLIGLRCMAVQSLVAKLDEMSTQLGAISAAQASA